MRTARALRGDGQIPTSALEPCRCPKCQQHLIITCPNACEGAELGAVDAGIPARDARPPRTDRPELPKRGRRRRSRGRKPVVGGTRDHVLIYLGALSDPQPVTTIARDIDAPVTVIDAMCRNLAKAGVLERSAPPGRKRPALYRVMAGGLS